jgi:NADH:ubiquinone oxidoreductase subunit D
VEYFRYFIILEEIEEEARVIRNCTKEGENSQKKVIFCIVPRSGNEKDEKNKFLNECLTIKQIFKNYS